jgi:putative chitinase
VSLTAGDWRRILMELGVAEATADDWTGAFAGEVQPEKFSRGMDDLLAFLPQVLHETGLLERTQENLTYTSAERIRAVWPSRFPTLESARPFVRNPEALANKVYGGRMGNTRPGDGSRYRGRGLIMVTGYDGYLWLGDLMGQDLTVNETLLEGPIYAACSAVHWWEGRVADSMLADTVQCRRRVNGGEVGLAHCQALADLTRKVFA